MRGAGDSLTWKYKSVLFVWVSCFLGFRVVRFLDLWFFGVLLSGFLVSWFLDLLVFGFLVSWCLGFLMSRLLGFENPLRL